jgi:hypothetical protein
MSTLSNAAAVLVVVSVYFDGPLVDDGGRIGRHGQQFNYRHSSGQHLHGVALFLDRFPTFLKGTNECIAEDRNTGKVRHIIWSIEYMRRAQISRHAIGLSSSLKLLLDILQYDLEVGIITGISESLSGMKWSVAHSW